MGLLLPRGGSAHVAAASRRPAAQRGWEPPWSRLAPALGDASRSTPGSTPSGEVRTSPSRGARRPSPRSTTPRTGQGVLWLVLCNRPARRTPDVLHLQPPDALNGPPRRAPGVPIVATSTDRILDAEGDPGRSPAAGARRWLGDGWGGRGVRARDRRTRAGGTRRRLLPIEPAGLPAIPTATPGLFFFRPGPSARSRWGAGPALPLFRPLHRCQARAAC